MPRISSCSSPLARPRARFDRYLFALTLVACSGNSNDDLGARADAGADDDRESEEQTEGGDPSSSPATLTVIVDGQSSIQFFTNQNERVICGGEGSSTCTRTFVLGSSADIQRTLSLPREEEARFRLASWGAPCGDVDADAEPRGGHCRLTMDRDHEVTVSFEQRAELVVSHTSPDMITFRWGLAYEPVAQKGGGNPLTLQGTFDCYLPGNPCEKRAMFDVGTAITVRAGSGSGDTNFKGWGGACATFGMSESCTFTLTGDTRVSGSWSYF